MIDIQSVLPGLTPSRRDQGGCLAPWQTSRGGVPFGKKKIALHQGSPRRDKGFRTKADLAWGGTLLEIKFLFTKAHPGVTKDLAPRQTSRGGGPFGNRNFLLPGMTPASPRRLAPRQTSRGGVSLLEIHQG